MELWQPHFPVNRAMKFNKRVLVVGCVVVNISHRHVDVFKRSFDKRVVIKRDEADAGTPANLIEKRLIV